MGTPSGLNTRVPPPPESQAFQGPLSLHPRRRLEAIRRLWFALALSVLIQPTPGVVAPDLGLLLNWALPFG